LKSPKPILTSLMIKKPMTGLIRIQTSVETPLAVAMS
jgi:hypothetical protein